MEEHSKELSENRHAEQLPGHHSENRHAEHRHSGHHHRHHAGHSGSGGHSKARRKKRTIAGAIILAAVIAAVVIAAGIYDRGLGKVEGGSSDGGYTDTADEDKELYFDGDLYRFTDRIETFLMIGTDASGNESASTVSDYAGKMADFLTLLVIDHTKGTYGFLQINRDTITEVQATTYTGELGDTYMQQICTAHAYGTNPTESALLTEQAVSQLCGEVKINGYYVLDMDDIATVNDAVGGVTVTLDDDFSSQDPAMTKGTTITLKGKQAEIFCRGRMGIGDGENTSRMARQRQYMTAFLDAAVQKIRNDPGSANEFYSLLKNSAVTDLMGNDISRIIQGIRIGENLGILTPDGEKKTGTRLGDGTEHAEFYADTQSIADEMATLYSAEIVEEDGDG